ncbi:MAG: DUF2924 domain-containing protein [Pirellulaceae bacterium]
MTSLDIPWELARLERMTVNELIGVYVETTGESARSRNKRYLIRRIAWHMQARAEGGLSERAKQRAAQLADDAYVRVTPPRGGLIRATTSSTDSMSDALFDPRLPAPGNHLVRDYKGRSISVRILPDGFEFDGQRFRSLSAVAKAVTGSHVNGFRFFRLGGAA